jgi:CheY-like chemotaxis protein
MKKILIIEDDQIVGENMAELLEIVGYKVDLAKDGKLGVEKAKSILPDLIICDIRMPELDGYGVLHILSKEPSTSTIPFIFVTAKTEREDLRKGMEMGADDYLTKPFEDTELLKAVETRLKKNEILNKNQKGDSELIKETDLQKSIKNLSDEGKSEDYKAKEKIYRIGDYPHFLFYIEKGEAKSYRLNEDGKELISNIYKKGDFFGFQPIIEDRTYNETAEALIKSQIKRIPKDHFLALIRKNKDVASKLIQIISQNLTAKDQELLHMAYDSVRKRVVLRINELLEDETNQTISISRTDLAALVGTTPETLVRILTELKDMDIIETDTHTITLLNREKLNEFAKAW